VADPHAMHGGMPMPGGMPGMEGMAMGGPKGADARADEAKDRLAYADLEALTPMRLPAGPAQKIDMRLTGDMNRYIWSINDKKLSEAKFFEARVGERLEIRLINETMMEHPMHMHGAFFVVDNGKGERAPLKHTVIVKPGETITVHTSFDEPGPWVFHCHLFYHAAAGMVQALVVK
jgi:FtsP/CotA-like multicopper oxidase with cupredoxin domain